MPKQVQLVSHIDHALVARLHPPMYDIHKYWARKPDNVVAEYIEHYSKEGEVVLDPFSGSGVTALEALRLERKAIGVDIDPVANFIATMTALPVDIDKLKKEYESIEADVKDEIQSYFKTSCPICGKNATIHYIVLLENKPTKIAYNCDNKKCKRKGLKDFTSTDLRKQAKIEKTEIPYWVPDNELIWNTRVNIARGTKVSDLFSRRNLIALSILYNRINQIEDEIIRNMVKFAFSAALPQASKLLVYTPGQGPGWKVRGYWVPPNRYEMNVWRFFNNKFAKLVKGKEESNALLSAKYSMDTFKIYACTATELGSIPELKENSVDYVFTDPPYGDNVPYLELNYMWASWLGFNPDFDEEIIISDSPVRTDKNHETYYNLLAKAFREVYRVLKPSKYMTVTFNNTNMEIYNDIIRAVILAGFDLEKIVYQPPARTSSKAQLAPYGSAYGDYYIRFQKPAMLRNVSERREPERATFERIVVTTVKRIIAERGQPTPYSLIVNSYAKIYDQLKNEGFLFAASQPIDDILRQHVGKEFVIVEGKWWFADPSVVPYIDRVPLAERVEKTVINALKGGIKLSFNDILQEVYKTWPNSLTPETRTVQEVLKEYAEKTSDKKWRLKQSITRSLNQHQTMVDYVARIGEKFGFGVIADIQGRRVTTLPFECSHPDRVKEIDAIWVKNSQPQYEFEVENTTGISDAIDRGSNLTYNGLKRVIVIPEERKALLKRKFSEEKFSEEVKQYGWRFIYYSELWAFYTQMRGRKKLTLADFDKLLLLPEQMKLIKQSKLDESVS